MSGFIKKAGAGKRGFTLIELIISIAIFAFMTALLVAKYGTFNQSVLLTNLAYDVASVIRTAQSYGLSVRAGSDSCDTDENRFRCAYGVTFDSNTPEEFVLYSVLGDKIDPDTFSSDNATTPIETYTMKRGAHIYAVCYDSGSSCAPVEGGKLDIAFLRPNPNAIMCFNGACNTTGYSEIYIKSPSGERRSVIIRGNGQISVNDRLSNL
jgi:prepilin-type N-terminal cleavage/methylation domain-containing protein